MNMTRNEFVAKVESLIKDYCKNNRDYDDVDDYFDFCFMGVCYRVSLEIESLGFDEDGKED